MVIVHFFYFCQLFINCCFYMATCNVVHRRFLVEIWGRQQGGGWKFMEICSASLQWRSERETPAETRDSVPGHGSAWRSSHGDEIFLLSERGAAQQAERLRGLEGM